MQQQKHILNNVRNIFTPLRFNIYSVSFIVLLLAGCTNDNGFTDPKEAKNLLIGGVKTGKWLIRLDSAFNEVQDSNAPYYQLAYYRAGESNGWVHVYYKSGKLRDVYPSRGYRPSDTVRIYYENGKLRSVLPFVHDTENGTEVLYNENGKLKAQSHKQNGQLNGPFTEYYPDGKLKVEMNYTDNNLDGPMKEYYESGKIKKACVFVNGKIEGNAIIYYENGNIQSVTVYANGKCNDVEKEFYENGALKMERQWEYNKLVGHEKQYSPTGVLLKDAEFKEGVLQQIQWFSANGKPDCQISFFNGERYTGVFKTYNDDSTYVELPYIHGLIQGDEKIFYRNGVLSQSIHLDAGVNNGITKYFWPNGKPECQATFVNGVLKSGTMRVDDDEHTEITYANGKVNGVKRGYYPNGNLKYEKNYKDDHASGLSVFYKPDGKTIDYKCTYDYGSPVSGIERNKFEKGGEGSYTEATYDNGKRNGSFKWFYPNGKLECECIYVNDTVVSGIVRKDYEEAEGGGYTEAPYVNGKLNGVCKWFYSDGKLNAQIPYNDNIQDGISVYYYKSGVKQEEIQWRDGRRMADATYDEQGKLQK